MIDEIPERDPLRKQSSNSSLSLTRLAVLLTCVFLVLLAMLLGSRALDTLAAKLWPAPSNTTSSVATPSTGTRIDISKMATPTIQGNTNSQTTPIPAQMSQPQVPQANPHLARAQQEHSSQQLGSSAQTLGNASATSTVSSENSISPTEKISPNPQFIEQPPVEILSAPNTGTLELHSPAETTKVTIAEKPPQKAANVIPIEADRAQKHSQPQQAEKKPQKPENARSYSAAEKEILKQDPRHYTLQILGMHNPQQLKKFIQDTQLQGKLRYCRGSHQGKPWYVLVYGEFATREEAEKALATLPETVKKQKPWIRSVASLQGTIHARE